MGLIHTSWIKLNPELPYMTRQECALFDKVKNDVSIFRLSQCPCGNWVPKHKTYCCEDCWKKGHNGSTESDGR